MIASLLVLILCAILGGMEAALWGAGAIAVLMILDTLAS